MPNIKIFLDHDGTLTYTPDKGRSEYYKNGVTEFLEFLTDKFDVWWCSGHACSEIINSLSAHGIKHKLLDKIKYFRFDSRDSKSQSILTLNEKFVLIDDDPCGDEKKTLLKNNLSDCLIKANDLDVNDLQRIKDVLVRRYLQK